MTIPQNKSGGHYVRPINIMRMITPHALPSPEEPISFISPVAMNTVRSQMLVTRSAKRSRLCAVVKAKNGEKRVVQCKRWRTLVGEPIIRDFYGTMQHEKAAQGAIIATKGFSQAAIRWAKGKPISLYDGNDFIRFWKRVKKQQSRKAKTGVP